MKSKHSLGVQFYFRRNRIRNGKVPLYVRITVDKHRSEFALKFRIAEADWNAARGMAKPRTEELKQLNTQLEQIRASLVSCYHELHQEQKLITAEAVKAHYLGVDESDKTLGQLIDYHNEKLKGNLSHGTMKNYYTTGRYLKKFVQVYLKKQDCLLSELDFKFITEFEFFLLKSPIKDHDPLSNNGLMKHIERLKKMSRLAVSLEWIAKDPFEKFKLRFEKVDRGYLSEHDLTKLQQEQLEDPQLQYVRDLFVFSCYTGLAYCDLMDLKKENLIAGIDGGKWISTHRQKTKIVVRVPLLDEAERILSDYENDPRTVDTARVFRYISNQEINRNLKIVAGICKIRQHLTFHLARHTFATTISISNGVPIETVSKMMGHTKIATTQIYARVVEQKISADMLQLKEQLRKKKASAC